MFLTQIIVPIIIISLGFLLYYKYPKKINPIIGYRTSKSMKNQETWDYANRLASTIFIHIGFILLILTLIINLIWLIIDTNQYLTNSLIVIGFQVITLLIPIVITEIKLKKTFDQDGNPR